MLFIVQIVVLTNLFLFGIYSLKKTKKVNGFAQIITWTVGVMSIVISFVGGLLSLVSY